MINIPDKFKTKTINRYGKEGEDWLNSIDNITLDNKCEFDEIISLVSKYYEEDKKLISETLYIYIIQKVIFYIKNKDNPNRILHNINICKKILQYID